MQHARCDSLGLSCLQAHEELLERDGAPAVRAEALEQGVVEEEVALLLQHGRARGVAVLLRGRDDRHVAEWEGCRVVVGGVE